LDEREKKATKVDEMANSTQKESGFVKDVSGGKTAKWEPVGKTEISGSGREFAQKFRSARSRKVSLSFFMANEQPGWGRRGTY